MQDRKLKTQNLAKLYPFDRRMRLKGSLTVNVNLLRVS